MPVGHEKKDKDEPFQKGHKETGEKKQGGHQQEEQKRPDAEAGGEQKRPDAEAGGEQKPEKKTPSLHITSPASGSAFPVGPNVPLDVECEGSGDFEAQFVVHDASGKVVGSGAQQVKLDENGKGHGELGIGTDWLGAGKFHIAVFGSSGGEFAPIQKVEIELVDEKGQEEAPPEPGVEGAGDPTNPLEVKGGGV